MNTDAAFWSKYQATRERLRAIRDQVDIAQYDLAALFRLLPSGSFPEHDMQKLVGDVDELAMDAHEKLEAALRKQANGVEADRIIDMLIGATH